MRHIVVGTAGHIDHGKSALVRALTGIDPDRLKEEKARGITIDLGFAHMELDDVQIGFVDVPGHERFVKNMLAGVGGIDLVTMVVAADESIMPQTREHFDICRLLGIRAGLVAVTKVDLVEPELVELVQEEVRETFRGSFLDKSPIVPVSSRTGQGMEALKRALLELAHAVPQRAVDRALRLPVDRSFTMRGFGTVITGTMISGSLRREAEVELVPGGILARVRGLQVHGKSTDVAVAGQRTAVNLQGVELAQVHRGMVLTSPRVYPATRMLDVRLQLLPSARPLKNLLRVRFHLGTAEVIARVALLGADVLEPGHSAYAQLRLDAPVFCLHNDPFIIRQFSPTITIGGGRVLNPQAGKHRSGDRGALEKTRRLDTAEPRQFVLALLDTLSNPAPTLHELQSFLDLPPPALGEICSRLAAEGLVTVVSAPSPMLVRRAALDELERQTVQYLGEFHAEYPLLKGMSREELRTRLFDQYPPEVFRHCLEELSARKQISLAEEAVSLFGREVRLPEEGEELKKRIEEAYLQAGYQPPSLPQIQAQIKSDPGEVRKIYHWMLKERLLVRITEDLAYHRTTLEEIKRKIRERHAPGEKFGVADFKELFDLTRKHAIPLLEYLDRERFTRRQGNDRILL